MSNIAFVYTTKYGHTKQYADWLKEDMDIDIIPIASFNAARALAYKLVIFASGVYGDKIQIMDFIKKNSGGINLQRIMIAAVTWYTNDSEEAKAKLINDNFPDNMKNVVPLYVINSGIDKKKITVVEKTQLLATQTIISRRDGRTSDDINTLAIIKGYSDQTAKENLDSLKKGIELHLNPPKVKEQPKPEPKPEPIPQEITEERQPEPAAEAPKPVEKPIPEPPKKGNDTVSEVEKAFRNLKAAPKEAPKPAPKQAVSDSGVVLTSLDDALAALSSGNVLAHKVPKHNPAPAPAPAPAPEPTPIPEPTPAPAAEIIEEPAAEEEISAADIKVEEVSYENNEPEQPKLDDISADEIKLDEVMSDEAAEEPQPSVSDISSDDISISDMASENVEAGTHRAPSLDDISAESIGINGLDGADIETADSEDDIVMSISEDIESLNSTAEEPVKPAAEPVFQKPTFETEKKEAAPRKNSYLEYFSRKNKTEAPAQSEPAAEAPKTEPAKEEVKPAHHSADPVFDPLFMTEEPAAPVHKPAPAPAPAPAPKPAEKNVHSSVIDDFDFDLMGGTSAASQPSQRALNAVNALAKAKADAAKAAAEAEKAAKEAAEYEAEQSAPQNEIKAEPVSDSYGSIDMSESHTEEKFADEPAKPSFNASEIDMSDEKEDEVIFSNDEAYDIDDEIAVVEEPIHNKGAFDFKKLQMEIEQSIEVNKKKKEQEKLRNTRELDREKLEEEEQKPKKGIKQPIDADMFFQRPGKDYYDSDTMPEIRFDRHRRG